MAKQEMIRQKRAELRALVREWAQKENVLDPGEYVSLSMRVYKNTKKRPVISGDLSEDDWKTILCLDWSSWQRWVIKRIKQNSGRPIRVTTLDLSYSRYEAINTVFRRNRLSYRLRKVTGVYWPEVQLKMCIVSIPSD